MRTYNIQCCLVLAALSCTPALAEDYVLRVDYILLEGREAEGVARDLNRHVAFDPNKYAHGISQSLEQHVTTGSKFFSRARVGGRVLQARGKLHAPSESGKQVLDIEVKLLKPASDPGSDPKGPKMESVTTTAATTTIGIVVGEPVLLGGAIRETSANDAPTPRTTCELLVLVLTSAEDASRSGDE